MKFQSLFKIIPVAGLCVAPILSAQAPNPTQRDIQVTQVSGPVFRVSVVEHTTKAVNYRHRSGSTKIDFDGTALQHKATGVAEVESKKGYMEIEAKFEDLSPATQFGPEYLTYVMWAITPEGRATNLGEILLDGKHGKLHVTTELQAFGMVVTAEPYFAVSQPSDVVVLENVIRKDTKGNVENVEAKYELLKRGTYSRTITTGGPAPRYKIRALELLEGDNAIALARSAGAEQYAGDTFAKAVQHMSAADSTKDKKTAIMNAREAVQMAEDSRLIALQRQEEARLAEERRIAIETTEQANRAAADAAARAASEADARRQADLIATAERARAEAERGRAEAEAAKAAALSAREIEARRAAELETQRAAAQRAEADAARIAAEKARDDARLEASRETGRLAKEREAAEAARNEALAAQRAAEHDAHEAREAVAKAAEERAELRSRLQQQLNLVLETRQTARGLIVNMTDVLFDTGQSTLKPGAREKLSKVAGILMAHPDLKLQVEGHTDSVGSDEYNQRLSENRAGSAREFLVAQGIKPTSISARGFGETSPVASNDSAAGRQQNRRVELVISGDSISQSGPDGSATLSIR